MRQKNVEEIMIRRLSTDITLSVFKHTDQADVVIILRQLRLNVLKISHMDRDIVTFAMPVGIDETALLRQINTGHTSRFPRQCPGDRPAAASNLKNLVRFLHRNPVHDIFTQYGQMIKDRPAPALLYDLCILDRRIFLHNVQHLILYRTVAVKIFSRVFTVIQFYLSNLIQHPHPSPLLQNSCHSSLLYFCRKPP